MALRAKMHQHAAEFFDEHGEHGKADREREPADREAQDGNRPPRASGGHEEPSDP